MSSSYSVARQLQGVQSGLQSRPTIRTVAKILYQVVDAVHGCSSVRPHYSTYQRVLAGLAQHVQPSEDGELTLDDLLY